MTVTTFPVDQSISDTLNDVKQQVRDNPTDAAPRIFLFQLLSLIGDWTRAKAQLELCKDLDAGTMAMVQTYREALACESFRADVFAGKRTPLIFGEPATWLASLLEALRLESDQQYPAAEKLREAAFADAPATSGSIQLSENESPEIAFDWIADADMRLGPTLEAIINGKYYWVPWNHIKQLHIEPPHDLRDFVWMPAFFEWTNGGESAGLIPTRYPGSESSSDDSIRLAKRTEWVETPSSGYEGLGQRMFATDADEYSLMDVRAISLQTTAAGAEAEEANQGA